MEAAPSARDPLASRAVSALLGSMANVLAGLVRSKVTAVYLGASIVGLVALAQQCASVAFIPVAVHTGAALVMTISAARDDVSRATQAASVAWTAVVLSAFGSTLASIVLTVALAPSELAQTTFIALLVALTSTFSALSAVHSQVLVARGAVADSARSTASGALAGAALVAFGAWTRSLWWYLVASTAASVVGWLLLWRTHRKVAREVRIRFAIDRTLFINAVKVGAATLLSSSVESVSGLFCRTLIERDYGLATTGLFQAAFTIGASYFGLVLSALGTVIFPAFAASDEATLKKGLTEAFDFVQSLAPPVILLFFGLRSVVVGLLLAPEFAASSDALGWLVAADAPRGVGWVLGGMILFRGFLREFVAIQALYFVVLMSAFGLLIPRIGLPGSGIGYMLANVATLPLAVWLLRARLGTSLPVRPLVLSTALGAVLGASLLLPLEWRTWSAWLFAAAGAALFLRSPWLQLVREKLRPRRTST